MSQIKDAAAQALGRKGGKARMQNLTPRQRSEFARTGGLARQGKKLPTPERWWCLLRRDADNRLHLEFMDQDKAAVHEYRRKHQLDGHITHLDTPPALRVTRKYGSNTTNEVKALERALSK